MERILIKFGDSIRVCRVDALGKVCSNAKVTEQSLTEVLMTHKDKQILIEDCLFNSGLHRVTFRSDSDGLFWSYRIDPHISENEQDDIYDSTPGKTSLAVAFDRLNQRTE